MSGAGRQQGNAALGREGGGESEALGRLRAGEATLDEYLDYRADRAVLHLETLLDAERLRVVRDTIREQLARDPVVSEMLFAVTGGRPAAPPGE